MNVVVVFVENYVVQLLPAYLGIQLTYVLKFMERMLQIVSVDVFCSITLSVEQG